MSSIEKIRKKYPRLDNNKISLDEMIFHCERFIPDKLILKGMKMARKYQDGKCTQEIEGINYDVVNPYTLDSFRIKVLDPTPVITQEELDEAEEHVYISIPVSQTVIKPYKIEYGKATVSIIAPYVMLSMDEEEEN